MQDRRRIQNYINNFRRHLAAFLRPGIGLKCKVHPVVGEGAILEFHLGSDVENEDEYLPAGESVNTALRHVEQRLVGGNIDGIKFGGTNISMEPNRIVLIKGEDAESSWNDEGAREDVERIVKPFQGGSA